MKRLLEKLLSTQPQSNWIADTIISLPRIVGGLLLAFVFGASKFGVPWSSNDLPLFGTPDWFIEDVSKFGGVFGIAPILFSWLAAASETFGGIMLALGLKTRLAAFMIMCTMLVAIFFQKWDSGVWGILPALGFLWVSLYSMVLGSGRLGIDYFLSRKIKSSRLLHTPVAMLNRKTRFTKATTILLLVTSGPLFAQDKTVVFEVAANEEDIQNIGIRGSVSPLSWNKTYPMTDEDGDGIFEAKITFNTSNPYVKFKFTNGANVELDGSDSRIVWFKEETIHKVYDYNEFEYYTEEQIERLTYTKAQIQEDLKLLNGAIQYLHPAVFQYIDSASLQMELKQIESELIEGSNLVSFYNSISKFVAKIKCSHTFTNPWNQGPDVEKAIFYQPDKLPITFHRIGNKLFVDKNASKSERIASGLEILGINEISTDSILNCLTQYVTSDGNNYEKKLERLSLNGSEKYSLFDIFYSSVFGSFDQFELQLKNHQTGAQFIETIDAVSKTHRTKILQERYGNIRTTLRDGWNFELLNEQLGALTIKSFAVQRNEFNWKNIIDDAIDELNDKSVPNLIIDIRGNEGGQGEVGEYILERIFQKPFYAPAMESSVRYLTIPNDYKNHISTWNKFPYDFNGKIENTQRGRFYLKQKYSVAGKTYKPRKNGYKGKVYLITDASNSSATHLMASYAKQVDEITIVGQATGGNQLGTNGGFIFFLRLPNSRIVVDIPVVNMFIPPISGEPKDGGIEPDIYVEKSLRDFIEDRDPAIEKILSIID